MNNPDFSPKIQRIFEKLSILSLEDERKAFVAKKMVECTYTDRLYWWEMLLSGVIATYGLLQNSVAIIIGAMLVAPLLRPLYGIAFGIASGQRAHMFRALKMLVASILLAVLVGYLAGILAPIQVQTSEMLSRTQPNIFDLIVAIASAIVAMLSLRYERLSESVAGVAIAAALLPPMVLVGIEIAYGRWTYAWGSAILCLTNLLTIIFVGVLIMVMYGFSTQVERHWSTVRLFTAMAFMLVIISIPLFNSLLRITEQYFIENTAQNYIQDSIEALQPEAKIQDVVVRFPIGEPVNIHASLRLPEGNILFDDTLSILKNGLAEKMEEDVQIDLDIIRSVSAVSRKQIENKTESPEQILEQEFENYFGSIFENTGIRLVNWRVSDTLITVIAYSERGVIGFQDKIGELSQVIQDNIDSNYSLEGVTIQSPDTSHEQDLYQRQKDIVHLLTSRIVDIDIVSVTILSDVGEFEKVNILLSDTLETREDMKEMILSELEIYDPTLLVKVYFL